MKRIYKVAEEFSRLPGGRLRAHGPYSGQQFREEVVLPLLEEFDEIAFDLNGSKGYSSGFLDEAFGELGVLLGLAEAKRRLSFIATDDPEAASIAWDRIEDAARENRS